MMMLHVHYIHVYDILNIFDYLNLYLVILFRIIFLNTNVGYYRILSKIFPRGMKTDSADDYSRHLAAFIYARNLIFNCKAC